MLSSIFYARFHSERGPVVLRQFPQSINVFAHPRNGEHDGSGLTQFSEISSYIIPPYELCNKPLSIAVNGFTILGLPISIEDQKYPRNRFTFNVCYVLQEGLDSVSRRAWNRVVSKTASWFKRIEIEEGMLLAVNEDNDVPSPSGTTQDLVTTILQQIFEQLSEYQECCVQISDAYVLNMRLVFEQNKAAKQACAWEVPLLIAELPSRDVVTWDLVLQQIYQYVNGINHIKRIAELADVELDLVRSTISTLAEQGNVMLLDTFHFQAIYALTKDFASFVEDADLLTECQQYTTRAEESLDIQDIIELYLDLGSGGTVLDSCMKEQTRIRKIDIRRFVTFGVIKGFLRRRHRYARSIKSTTAAAPKVTQLKKPYEDAVKQFEEAWRQAALSSGWSTPPTDLPASVKVKAHKTAEEIRRVENERLMHYLDGQHCFDQICIEMGMTEKALMERLNADGPDHIMYFMK